MVIMARHGQVGFLFLLLIQWTLAENGDGANDNYISIKQELARLTQTVRDLTRRDEVQTQKIQRLEREMEMNYEKQSEEIAQIQSEMAIQNEQLTETISQMECEIIKKNAIQTEKVSKLERELAILRKQSVEKELQELENRKLVKQLTLEIDELRQMTDYGVDNVTVYNDDLKVLSDRFEEDENVQPDTRKDNKYVRGSVNEIQKTNDTVKTVKRSSNGNSRGTRAEGTQVAFSAIITPHDYGPLGVNQIVLFDGVLSNIGNAYHAHSGIFIAPVSGTYVFSVTISGWKNSVGYSYLHIMKNGRSRCTIWAASEHQSTQVLVLNLLANDEIYVTNDVAHDIILGATYSSFSGFLLYAGGENMIIG